MINKKIPKNRFYSKMDAPTKRFFTASVDSIVLLNKLSTTTTNIKSTKNVEEIFLIKINFNHELYQFIKDSLLKKMLTAIDTLIPYKVLFFLDGPKGKLSSKVSFFIAYKEKFIRNLDNCKVLKYYNKSVEIKKIEAFEKELNNTLSSLNLEIVYEKLIKLIVGSDSKLNLATFVENTSTKERLISEIDNLENKVKSEKQADKQYDYFMELKQKKKELGMLVS